MLISKENEIIRNKLLQLSIDYSAEQICSSLLHGDNFFYWSGSSKPTKHHYGTGGLAKHTFEVIKLCESVNDTLEYKGVDYRQLFLAALFHDVGKIYDYEECKNENGEWVWMTSEHKYKIHHITRSALIFNEAWRENYGDKDLDYKDEIIHAILSHHGQLEWGSPVIPTTALAWILHNCDNISARTEECYNNVRLQSKPNPERPR